MHAWKLGLVVALPATATLLIVYLLLCCLCRGKSGSAVLESRNLYVAAVRASKRDILDAGRRHSNRVASVWRATYPIKPFNWSENQALIAEAVEHGWATFAFTYNCSACPAPSNFWDMCRGCSHVTENEPEICWEMGAGADFMQKIRLNPGLRMKKDHAAVVQSLQTALPLPGPPLGDLSFPQEAYYEITISVEGPDCNGELPGDSFSDNDHAKLISKHLLAGKQFGFDIGYANQSFENRAASEACAMEDRKAHESAANQLHGSASTQFGKKDTQFTLNASPFEQLQLLSVGLAAGGAPPFRFPGCDRASIGFCSNGHIYLNGAPHIEEHPKLHVSKRRWGLVNSTVGCGFDPAAKRVFFTLNGERVYEHTIASSEFGNPLYPTIAANYDVTLLANFGQSSFEYSPANSNRIPDPCFRRLFSKFEKNGSVYDSEDLFSMEKIDSPWLKESESSKSHDMQHRHALSETESDLFEIVLERQT
eukprot:c18657_g1_i1 orf=670-2109(-)